MMEVKVKWRKGEWRNLVQRKCNYFNEENHKFGAPSLSLFSYSEAKWEPVLDKIVDQVGTGLQDCIGRMSTWEIRAGGSVFCAPKQHLFGLGLNPGS